MSQNFQRGSNPNNPRTTRTRSTVSRFPIQILGQATISDTKDVRLEKRFDVSGQELYALMEYIFYGDPSLPVVPVERWVGTQREFEHMAGLFNLILDEKDAGGNNFPILLTKRYKGGGNHGR